MEVEKATYADIPEIGRLNKVFRKYSDVHSRYERESWLTSLMDDMHVMRDARGIAGLCCVEFHASDMTSLYAKPPYAYIVLLNVRPDKQGEGLGRTFIRYAADQAREEGMAELRVGSNIRFGARGFYQACGFELDETLSDDFADRFVMRLG